jgi:hypothetical protein
MLRRSGAGKMRVMPSIMLRNAPPAARAAGAGGANRHAQTMPRAANRNMPFF